MPIASQFDELQIAELRWINHPHALTSMQVNMNVTISLKIVWVSFAIE